MAVAPPASFLNNDFIVVGEFCEIQGPVVVQWSWPKEWLSLYCAALSAEAAEKAQILDAYGSMDRRPGEPLNAMRTKWQEARPGLEAAVRKVCNALVMRTLTGDIVHNASQMSSSAIVCIDSVPWVGDAMFGSIHETIHELSTAGTTIATTSAVVSIPDSTARGFSRTLCIIHASRKPLVGEQAAVVTGQLRSWSLSVSSAAESNHVKELHSFHARLTAVTTKLHSPDVVVDPKEMEQLAERDKHAIEHFMALEPHLKRRFFEEQSAVAKRLAQLNQVPSPEQLQSIGMATSAMTERILKKGSQVLRGVQEIAPLLHAETLRLPETSSHSMRKWATTMAPTLAYASLCNLNCCIVAAHNADQDEVGRMETMCQGIFGDSSVLDNAPQVPHVSKLSLGCFDHGGRVVRCDAMVDLSRFRWQLPVVAVFMSTDGISIKFPIGWADDGWSLPPESCIASSLRAVEDVYQLVDAMEELREYMRGRAMLRLLSTEEVRIAFETVNGLGSANTGRDTGGPVESVWLLNCLRCQAAVLLNGRNVICTSIEQPSTVARVAAA